MKLTLMLTLFFALNAVSAVHSQKTNLSLNLKGVTLEKAFDAIEKATGYSFFYHLDRVDLDKKVSIRVSDKPVTEVLDAILDFSRVDYRIIDKSIIIMQAKQVFEQKNQQKNITVTGRVIEKNGDPLPGVNVYDKSNSSHGVITSVDGTYSIEVSSADAVLGFSFVGFEPQEIHVASRKVINVTLLEKSIALDEVVSIGYGTQKKVNLTGSVASISSEELTKRPVGNVGQLMQGKMAGVDIFSNSGQPGGEGVVIRIRGLNSFGSTNSPIVLVDGVEGSLNDLDPDNVESISVLKDASSAAIYGSRAANGVVLVTTKRGKAGVFNVQYHGNFAINTPTRLPELVNDPVEYMNMFNLAQENSGLGNRYPDDIIQKYKSGEIQGFNWDDVMFKNPFVQRHNLTITGGTEKLRFSFAGGYFDQDGVVIGSSFKRYNVRLSVDADINKYFSFGTNISAVHGKQRDSFNGSVDLMLSTYASIPTYAPKLPDGRPVGGAYDFESHNKNPVTAAEHGGRWNNTYNLNGNAYINITPFKGFTWKTSAAVKYDHTYYKQLNPSVLEYNYITEDVMGYMNAQGQNELWVNQPFQTLYTLYSTFNYETTINDAHNLKILAGYSQENFSHNYINGYRKGMPIEELRELNAGSTNGQRVSGSSYEWALQSFFGRVNYDYRGKYLAEVNFRYDGSSRFQKENRWGLFPSFSAGWRVSEEGFASGWNWLSNLKVRASWGKLGNQLIGNYPYQSILNLGYGYPFGDAITAGAVQTSLSNPNISWETTQITDLGFDLDIHNGLFSLTFDYYSKLTTDILRRAQIMGHVGLSAPIINDGEMKNKGFDFIASHRKSFGDFSYNLSFTFSKYNNELVKYGAEQIGGQTIKREGLPWDSWYMLEFDGIFQSQQDIDDSPTHFYTPTPGDIKLKDQDGDGDVDQDDRVVMSGKYPDFTYGVNINLRWKNLDFSAFIQGVNGAKNYVTMWGIEPFIQGSRPPVKWRDAWSPTNPTNDLPKLYFGFADTNNRQISTFYLQDASYSRLKNIQFGYNFPKHILTNTGMQNLRIYFSGDNLVTITNYDGADPERNETGWRNYANYPQVKVYSLGLKVTF